MMSEELYSKELAEELRPFYLKVKVLDDFTVACLSDLLFTRAIILVTDRNACVARYCFEDRARADAEFEKLESEDDVPKGFIARR